MNKTAKKSLEHIQVTLNSIVSYNVYQSVNAALGKHIETLTDNERLVILKACEAAMAKEMDKVSHAKSWLKAIIDDIQ